MLLSIKEEQIISNINEDDDIKIREIKEKKLKIIKGIIETIPMEIIILYNKISQYRNDVSHFGFTRPTVQYTNFDNEIKELYEKFKNIVEENKDNNFF